MVKLRDLLLQLPTELFLCADWQSSQHPGLDQTVTGLSTNSFNCQAGDLFLGMPGTRVDGGDFWASALEQGAIAALVSASVKLPENGDACVIPMTDMGRVCGEVANRFHDRPSRKLQMVGVTGTNGKTTTTHLIDYLLQQANAPSALLGTLYARWPGYQATATHTTPFAVELQAQLAQAVKAGCQFGVMEVSSHALDQGRVQGCEFAVAVFTNLTQDHLDYHLDLDHYFEAKARLFSPAYLRGRAIINGDDPYGQTLIARLDRSLVWTYSTQSKEADLHCTQLTYHPDGVEGTLHTPQGDLDFRCPLVGEFNVANLLAAVGAVLALDLPLEGIGAALPHFEGVPGRMQQIKGSPGQDIGVIVDYAHTPDSLENLLRAARPFVQGKMICVFGCGGDRDRTKRPLMGGIAARLADQVVVTSDNPRTEDPQMILNDILSGIPESVTALVEVDRRRAIQRAIDQAQPGDTVLIAGKGHEDYQILGTEKIHFDDREEALAALAQKY
ncbi:UDP-N-acetylmuramoyl-L-alanyl-D-glutamate--2,6-diaminopimelate ligase [Lyngbya confervoides]|uniref:UDP-N-acetylmuramoyl-L-alanyl-D-glutamate--2,6-diaminopimelate ligase n=1 Tax=Lyngbya confervoides BDU141951 TaxID=1574623 RepID=A0ABD4T0F6_9CYAN|nr:UDP-N-acetylmuramoyl-L-alanyl-D-glutamate--2,6-diaminopimelate ligase [Lyngbya confervoides]MCM1981911.1 UDP-N-acetylmuramoyl-L-alanyl-D-glutamate--2,6-diaminopimelate ligase [Lyngbya confervoides BDU141951]